MLLITLGWAAGSLISDSVSQAVYNTDRGLLFGTIRGLVGGLITSLVLLWTAFAVDWKHIVVMTLGWTISWTLGQIIGPPLYDALHDPIGDAIFLWFIPGAIVGAISVAIGAIAMFWQLGQARLAKSPVPTP